MKYRIVHCHLTPDRFDVEMKKWWQLNWRLVCGVDTIADAVRKIEIDYQYKKPFSIVQPFRV